jgi:ribonuclease HI
MPVIECDVAAARERLEAAGLEPQPGNTDHERWRVEAGDATAVAYDGRVVIQGTAPGEIAAVLRDEGGRVHVYCDGASRGNPGPAAVGWVLVSGDGIVADGGRRIGTATNNRAEYEALVTALKRAGEYGFDTAAVRSDSQLVVRQVNGVWEVNDPDLRECRVRAREALAAFDEWSLTHVPREVNERADELANEALDEGNP